MSDVIQPLITQLNRSVIAGELLQEIATGTADSFGIGVVVEGRLLKESEHGAFLFWR
jgi:hypothetical protein